MEGKVHYYTFPDGAVFENYEKISLICQDISAFGGVFGLYLVSEQDADLYLVIIGWILWVDVLCTNSNKIRQ